MFFVEDSHDASGSPFLTVLLPHFDTFYENATTLRNQTLLRTDSPTALEDPCQTREQFFSADDMFEARAACLDESFGVPTWVLPAESTEL